METTSLLINKNGSEDPRNPAGDQGAVACVGIPTKWCQTLTRREQPRSVSSSTSPVSFLLLKRNAGITYFYITGKENSAIDCLLDRGGCPAQRHQHMVLNWRKAETLDYREKDSTQVESSFAAGRRRRRAMRFRSPDFAAQLPAPDRPDREVGVARSRACRKEKLSL